MQNTGFTPISYIVEIRQQRLWQTSLARASFRIASSLLLRTEIAELAFHHTERAFGIRAFVDVGNVATSWLGMVLRRIVSGG
jgi:hypothetical protein